VAFSASKSGLRQWYGHCTLRRVMRERPQCLLIATDFSESSGEALMRGFDMSSQLGKSPHVLHVCPEVAGRLLLDEQGEQALVTPEQAQRFVAEHVDRCLARYLALGGRAAFDIVVSHVMAGAPAKSIVKFADELQVSLIVVGASRQAGLGRSLGSTAAAVVRDASVPVLVVQQSEASAEAQGEPACPACIDVRRRSSGFVLWCQYHRDPQVRRHTYHYPDEHEYRDKHEQLALTLPLLFPMTAAVPRALERG
jgi:nucleotide-binding universal stress UspA family protein